jgi:hypothetical protein
MGDQAGEEDASGSSAQAVDTSIGHIDAGVVPTWRNLVRHALIVGDQHSGSADH